MIRAPKYLSEPMRRWVHQLQRDFDFEPRHVKIAVEAAGCWDRLQQIRQEMEGQPLTVSDRYGMPKTHPLVIEERQQKKLFAQLVRELGLDIETETPRIPKTGGLLYATSKNESMRKII